MAAVRLNRRPLFPCYCQVFSFRLNPEVRLGLYQTARVLAVVCSLHSPCLLLVVIWLYFLFFKCPTLEMFKCFCVLCRTFKKKRKNTGKTYPDGGSGRKRGWSLEVSQLFPGHCSRFSLIRQPLSSGRKVLTTPQSWQYAVLLNKFNSSSEVENELHLKGYRLLFPETSSCFRQSLKCYISSTPGKFPAQKHRVGKLKEYYLLNAASVLAVLALEVENGEKVLDMCAAPGGKSIATLQYAWPGLLHSNEYDNLRSNWLKQTLESFIPESSMNLVIISQLDGRQIGSLHPEAFDKVLVDAPCSNDRSWLFSADTHQATLRLAQRKALSAVQMQLLRSAVQALRPGGSLVYSTCTLSKAENSDVITHILRSYNNVLPGDLSALANSASHEFTLASDFQQHELLVLPEMGKPWGPMYISKLKKI